MKNLILLAVLVFVATGCSVKADMNDLFAGIGGKNSASVDQRTFVSECQAAGPASFKLVGKTYDSLVALRQVTYGGSTSCIGNPASPSVDDEIVSHKDYKAIVGENELLITPNDGVAVALKNVDKHTYANEVGLATHYAGTAVNSSGTTRAVSFFTQVIGQSPYSGFPYLWVFVNGVETQTQTNPWVWSGAKSSVETAKVIADCTTPETITVPAGTFKTCLVERGDGVKVWYGNAPLFGIIKLIRPPNTSINSTLERIASSADAISIELTAVNY